MIFDEFIKANFRPLLNLVLIFKELVLDHALGFDSLRSRALGVFYARVGLVTEAEREFQKLIQLNPQSEPPRKLLQSVRSGRKAN